jgi:hypothetical protein
VALVWQRITKQSLPSFHQRKIPRWTVMVKSSFVLNISDGRNLNYHIFLQHNLKFVSNITPFNISRSSLSVCANAGLLPDDVALLTKYRSRSVWKYLNRRLLIMFKPCENRWYVTSILRWEYHSIRYNVLQLTMPPSLGELLDAFAINKYIK